MGFFGGGTKNFEKKDTFGETHTGSFVFIKSNLWDIKISDAQESNT